MRFLGVHHVAIIATDYARSKIFYTDILGGTVLDENYRGDRDSWKLDIELTGGIRIELFSFPDPPVRPSRPEAAGLRHLALAVEDVAATLGALRARGVRTEELRTDEHTGKHMAFFFDPDDLPLELYEA
ncbi:MAG: VOC family protein [Nocardia sp.]|nr:VOC family protein [Nocardia sp.]